MWNVNVIWDAFWCDISRSLLARPPRVETNTYKYRIIRSAGHPKSRWCKSPANKEWYNIWLVVYLPLWKIWKSVGMILPNMWKHQKCSKPPTRYCSICSNTIRAQRWMYPHTMLWAYFTYRQHIQMNPPCISICTYHKHTYHSCSSSPKRYCTYLHMHVTCVCVAAGPSHWSSVSTPQKEVAGGPAMSAFQLKIRNLFP
jgi:hypothetical protein